MCLIIHLPLTTYLVAFSDLEPGSENTMQKNTDTVFSNCVRTYLQVDHLVHNSGAKNTVLKITAHKAAQHGAMPKQVRRRNTRKIERLCG